MKRNLLIGICMMIIPLLNFSQADEEDYAPTRAMGFGLIAHTYGIGLDVQYLHLAEKWGLALDFSLSSFKHRKEQKIASVYQDQDGKDFIWDKRNYFYVFNAGVGINRRILNIGSHNKVGVNLSMTAGPAFGFLKPYYIEVAVPVSPTRADVDEVKYDASTYTYTEIVGEADYFLGINELKIVPGLNARIGAMLDFSGSLSYVRGVEVSAFGQFFPKKVEILDTGDNKAVFLGGAVSIFIGNTW